MPRLSKGLILHGIRTYSGTEEAERHIFGSQGKAEVHIHILRKYGRTKEQMRNFSSLAVMAERKCGSTISHFWQLKQSVSGEAELQIFDSQGRAEVPKRNFTFLEVLAEMKWTYTSLEEVVEQVGKRNLRSFEFLAEQKFGKPNVTSLPVKAARKRTFRPLEVLAEQNCGSWISYLWQSRQDGSAEAEYGPPSFSWIFSLLLKDLISDFYLTSLQLVLCRVAAVKRFPVHQP